METIRDVINEKEFPVKSDLKTVMKSWLYYKGYPILNVRRNYQTKRVEIEQKRFFTEDLKEEEEKLKDQIWLVPVTIATQGKPDFDITMPDLWLDDVSIDIPIEAELEEWILLNKQQSGKSVIFLFLYT